VTSDPERLRACLGGPEWAWLRQRLRQCLEQERPLPAVCRRAAPAAAEWEAAAALMGRPAGRPGNVLLIRPAELEARLQRAGLCASLRDALEVLDGPIRSAPAEARRERALWAEHAEGVEQCLREGRERLSAQRPDLDELVRCLGAESTRGVEWWRMLCGRDAAAAEALRDALARVFATLAELGPSQVHRGHLAARALGNSHALDSNTVIYRALAALAGEQADRSQDVWAAYGVVTDEVSSSVLTLNLHFEGDGLAAAASGFAAAGEPCRLLLRHLPKLRSRIGAHAAIFVCENPTVLEAAAIELGVACRPMICTEGQPSLACQCLLAACAERTPRLCYHGDYDWGGIRIANFVWQIVPGMIPWRYDAGHYARLTGGAPLAGTPLAARWDPCLEQAMSRRAEAFHEEQVLPELLNDLKGESETVVRP
jgi:uncharacterized protein (TIGR02679 family)